MSRSLHQPERICMGCAVRAPQRVMLRIQAEANGKLVLAGTRIQGRSGYLHRDKDCWGRFAGRKGLLRSLGCSISRDERLSFVNVLEETIGPKSEVTGHVA